MTTVSDVLTTIGASQDIIDEVVASTTLDAVVEGLVIDGQNASWTERDCLNGGKSFSIIGQIVVTANTSSMMCCVSTVMQTNLGPSVDPTQDAFIDSLPSDYGDSRAEKKRRMLQLVIDMLTPPE